MPSHRTASDNRTTTYSTADWKGQTVLVSDPWDPGELCHPGKHRLSVMHHFDEEMRHFCPTGYLMCEICGGVAEEPEPHECTRWAA